ncbi:MAG: type II CAAX endopeptidase family protein [Candidatus Thorarchaeota archaeon]|nr:type II CAAX endopeptidase family protein [Candidatus Thorarchaeota archaeon]
MTTTEMQSPSIVGEEPDQFKHRLGLIPLSIIMLAIGIAWRVVDVMVLDLGSTWLNILPSKLFPLIILLFVLWRYYEDGLGSTLGLTKENMKAHIVLGIGIGFSFFLAVDLGGAVLYSIFVDPTYSTSIIAAKAGLLAYSFIFFFINAVYEETLFRGLLQNGLREKITIYPAIMTSSIIFGVWHAVWPVANGSPIGEGLSLIIFSGIIGGFFGIYYEKFASRKSLIGPIAAHTLFNFMRECFKVGAAGQIEGPDVSFSNPIIMAFMMVLFLGLFGSYFVLAYRYRVESVEMPGTRFREKIANFGNNESTNTTNNT